MEATMVRATRSTRKTELLAAFTAVIFTAVATVNGAPARGTIRRAAVPAATPAGPFTVDMTNREDVRQFYFRVHDASNGVDPGWTGGSIDGCAPGTVSQDFLDATLTRINYFRAMAGVPSNVTFDPT